MVDYIWFEQVVISNAVKDVDDLNIPTNATHVTIQADNASSATGIRYTLDGIQAPTVTSGFLLPAAGQEKQLTIAALQKIQFIRDGSVDGALHLHYFAGRDI